MTEPNTQTLALHPDLRFRAVGGQGVLVDQRVPEILVVNDLALRIIELVRDTGSRQAVLDTLVAEYEAPADQIESDLDAYLAELAERGLLTAPQLDDPSTP